MHFPVEIIESFKSQNVVLFIGAGLSMNSGLPSWLDLFRPLENAIDYKLPSDSSYITTEHLLTLAQYYENLKGRNALVRYLRDNLDTYNIKPSDVHYLIASLPIKFLFTTNYDNLLERTFQDIGKRVSVIVDNREFAFQSNEETKIIKLCGDLNRPASIAVTKKDFNIFTETRKGILQKLRTSLETQTMLFLGYGLKDPFINHVWDSISFEFGPLQRIGYSVMFDARPIEVDDLERRKLKVINLPGANPGIELAEWLKQLRSKISS